MLRGVMLTPWFAVSVGIVVAASLTLAEPRAALTYPPSASGGCGQSGSGCTPARGITSGRQLPAPRDEVRLRISARRLIKLRPSPIKVEYQVLPRHRGQFTVVIVLVSPELLGKWSLRFSLPGARVTSVMWARWEVDGHYGLAVDGLPLPWPRSRSDQARIVIFGTGTPRWPGHCIVNDARCTFRALRGTGRHGSPATSGA